MSALRSVIVICFAVVWSLPAAAQAEVPKCCRKAPATVEAPENACCKKQADEKPFASKCCSMHGEDESSMSDDASSADGSRGKHQGKGMMGGGGHHGVMRNAHTLVFNYGSLQREVEEIDGGVRTVTTTADPDLVALVQKHPREMDAHLSSGGHVRRWDPLFAELAKQHEHIEMVFRDLVNGIEVTSTSEDPEVVKLIRAHAYKVSEFVSRGRAAMHEATPLPEDYN